MRKAAITVFILFWSIYIFAGDKSSEKDLRLKTVVIDAGHGGHDPGALGKHSQEKNITLAVALKLGSAIKAGFPDVKVIYTRSTDVFVELNKRAEIANKNDADLFISIHVNSNVNPNASGVDTWVLGQYKNNENLQVAKTENKVILAENNYNSQYEGFDPTSAESYIIFNLLQNTFIGQSLEFATEVQRQVDNIGRKDRGVESAPFLVLWKTTMPSVLVETGFISNSDEENILTTDEGQQKVALAIFKAFAEYKIKVDSRTNIAVFEQDQNKKSNTISEKKQTIATTKTDTVSNSHKTSNTTVENSSQKTVNQNQNAIKPNNLPANGQSKTAETIIAQPIVNKTVSKEFPKTTTNKSTEITPSDKNIKPVLEKDIQQEPKPNKATQQSQPIVTNSTKPKENTSSPINQTVINKPAQNKPSTQPVAVTPVVVKPESKSIINDQKTNQSTQPQQTKPIATNSIKLEKSVPSPVNQQTKANPTQNKPVVQQVSVVPNKTPLPVNKSTNQTISNTKTPTDSSTIYFSIQILSSSKRVKRDSTIFKGIQGIREIKLNGAYKYLVGNETDFNKIVPLKNKTRETFPDAFIVATRNGLRISITEAIEASKK